MLRPVRSTLHLAACIAGVSLPLSLFAAPAEEAAAPAFSLAECRRLALTQNLTLQAQREAFVAAGFLRAAEVGAFEPEFVASIKREKNIRENTVEQRLSQGVSLFREDNVVSSVGLEGVAPTGTRYRVGWSEKDITNNLRIVSTDPFRREFQGFLGASVTQPLLKDFGFSANLARLRLAKGDEKIARQEYRRQMMLVVGAVETAYWDLYVAQERLRMRAESIDSAETLLRENKERVKEGKMAPIELLEAEAGLAQRKSLAAEATQQVVEASTRLKTLFAESASDDSWQLVASDTPAEPSPLPALADVAGATINLHPEYLVRLHRAEQEKVRVAYARNQRWPQVDLVLSYGKNGLGPDRPSYWYDLQSRDYEAWSVGVEVRVPITAGIRQRNEVKASKAKQREALLNLKAAEVEIVNALVGAQRKVEGLLAVMANHQGVAEAARKLVENEQARLVEGKSDSRRLLEVENQKAEALIASVVSRGEYEKARVEWELASGRILETRGFDLQGDVPGVAAAKD